MKTLVKRIYFVLILAWSTAWSQEDIKVRISESTLYEALNALVDARAVNFGDYTNRWYAEGWFVNLDGATIDVKPNKAVTLHANVVATAGDVANLSITATVHVSLDINGVVRLDKVGSGYKLIFKAQGISNDQITLGSWGHWSDLISGASPLFIQLMPEIELNSGTKILPEAITSYFTDIIPTFTTTETEIIFYYTVAGVRKINAYNEVNQKDNIGNIQEVVSGNPVSYTSPQTFWWNASTTQTHQLQTPVALLDETNGKNKYRNWFNLSGLNPSQPLTDIATRRIQLTVDGDATYKAKFDQAQHVQLSNLLEGSYNGGAVSYQNSVGQSSSGTTFDDYDYKDGIGGINTSVSNGTLGSNWYFTNWSDGNTSQSRNIVVNTDKNLIANYKGHLLSAHPNATGSTSQRKIVKTYGGAYGANGYSCVYESGGEVWYTRSADNINWTPEIKLSRGSSTAHNPSISEVYDYSGGSAIYVVWVDVTNRTGATGYDINVKKLDVNTNQWSPTEAIVNSGDPYNTQIGLARADAKPVAVSFIENSIGWPKVIVAYEGANNLGIRYSFKGWNYHYGAVVWNNEFILTTNSSHGRPSMTLAYDANYDNYLALSYDDGSNVYLAKSDIFYYNDMVAWVTFYNNPGIVIPTGYQYTQIKNSVISTDVTGRVHVAWSAYDDDYSSEVVLERSKDLSGNWSYLNHFASDLANAPNMTVSIAGDNCFDGATMLFSDGEVLFNMFASNNVSWTCKSLNSYVPNYSAPRFPNLVARGDFGDAGSVLTLNQGAIKRVVFENRNYQTSGYASLQKSDAGNQSGSSPLTKSYKRIVVSDSSRGIFLSAQLGDILLDNKTNKQTKNLEFAQRTNFSDVSCMQSGAFYTSDYPSIDFHLKVNSKNWSKNNNISLDLVDSATGQIISTIYTERIIGGIDSKTQGRIKKDMSSVDGKKSVYLALHLDKFDTTKYQTDIAQVMSISNKTKLKKQSEQYLLREELPTEYALSQNYPNPFNPTTMINYAIPKDGMVTIKIYDALGREVTTLVNDYKETGRYSVEFNASKLSSGMYVYKLASDKFTEVKKMMLVK